MKYSFLLLLTLYSVGLTCGLQAQTAQSSASSFLRQLKDTKWHMFGATSIKQLHYGNREVSLVNANGNTVGNPLPMTVVRPGIAFWDIDANRQNWCFYSARVQESIGAIVTGGAKLQIRGSPKRLPISSEKAFVSSLDGLVWETEDKSVAFTWKDGHLAVRKVGAVKDEEYTCKPVLPGVLQWHGVDGNTTLYVFDESGSHAWFLFVDRLWVTVKDGSLKSAPKVSGDVAGLSPFEQEVLLGLEHCIQAGEQDLSFLAYGELRQRLIKRKAPDEVLRAVHRRIDMKE